MWETHADLKMRDGDNLSTPVFSKLFYPQDPFDLKNYKTKIRKIKEIKKTLSTFTEKLCRVEL
jgi:hypothetical protein